ncbi:MAG: hypothetical protein IJY88_08260 [Clostridia bacterium]|nr:hypothetical protein [Clostridia bacterium]
MKKFLSLLLSFVVIVTLSACNKKSAEIQSGYIYLRVDGIIAKIDVATAIATPLCPDPICKHIQTDCPYSSDSDTIISLDNNNIIFIKNKDGYSIVCNADLINGEVDTMFQIPGVLNNVFRHGEYIYFPNCFASKDNNGNLVAKCRVISAPISNLSNYSVIGEEIDSGTLTYIQTDETGFIWMTDTAIIHSDFEFLNIKEYIQERNETIYGYGDNYLLFNTQEQALYSIIDGKKDKFPYSASVQSMPNGAFVIENVYEAIGSIQNSDGTENKIIKHHPDIIRYFDYDSGNLIEVGGFEKSGYYNLSFEYANNSLCGNYILLKGSKLDIRDGIVLAAKPIYLIFNIKTGEWKRVTGLNAFQSEFFVTDHYGFKYEYDD